MAGRGKVKKKHSTRNIVVKNCLLVGGHILVLILLHPYITAAQEAFNEVTKEIFEFKDKLEKYSKGLELDEKTNSSSSAHADDQEKQKLYPPKTHSVEFDSFLSLELHKLFFEKSSYL